jgi:dTDP-4-amino-4,6-dideoxygalactose transaminase
VLSLKLNPEEKLKIFWRWKMMNVPFVDLKLQHQNLKNEIMPVIEEAILNAQFIGGQNVSKFEEEFANFCGTKYAVGVNSGTDALRFAFLAAGIQPGDEIITVPNTFIATTEAISQVGAKIVFVDIDEKTNNIDVEKLEAEVIKRTKKNNKLKAIVPVHLYGALAHMEPIMDIARKYNLKVIEDACQAHGALYINNEKKQQKAGSIGEIGCFSFYPGKNLGACGEGGAVATNDEQMALKIKMIRDHGQSQKYYHEIEGYNGRLDAIQAGILRIKLRQLPEWNEKRRQSAALYYRLLKDVSGISLPYEPPWSKSVYHVYVIKLNDRDKIQKELANRGIATALHYPVPLHLQNAYNYLGFKVGDFPVAEECAQRILSLPMFAELTQAQIEYVAQNLKELVR